MHILIIRTGALGDVILTLPVLAALKQHDPEIRIDVLGNTTNLSLLIKGGYAQAIHSIDDRELVPLFVKDGLPSSTLCQMMSAYDLVISYLPDPDDIFTDQLRKISKGPVLTGPAKPFPQKRTHMTRVLLDILLPLHIASAGLAPVLSLPVPIESHDHLSTRPMIAVHPGSGGRHKCWPADRYAALIHRIVALGYQPVVTVGPADEAVCAELLCMVAPDRLVILENRPLKEMATLLAQCRGMIGNDTGMTHLAAAVGTPVVALFGPTDPAVWGPCSPAVRILWGQELIDQDVTSASWPDPFVERSLADIEVDRVIEVIQTVMGPL